MRCFRLIGRKKKDIVALDDTSVSPLSLVSVLALSHSLDLAHARTRKYRRGGGSIVEFVSEVNFTKKSAFQWLPHHLIPHQQFFSGVYMKVDV